jgi:hypothetical protein
MSKVLGNGVITNKPLIIATTMREISVRVIIFIALPIL